jgi:hemerythrin superfamily protein
MRPAVAYDDAVDLLEADHKAIQRLFMDYGTLRDGKAPAEDKGALAQRICQALSVHAQLEEEIFYPQIREAIGDDALMDEALEEHAEAKTTMARVAAMSAGDAAYDATVEELRQRFDRHVLEERRHIFLKARYEALDLRAMMLQLQKRQRQLRRKAAAP